VCWFTVCFARRFDMGEVRKLKSSRERMLVGSKDEDILPAFVSASDIPLSLRRHLRSQSAGYMTKQVSVPTWESSKTDHSRNGRMRSRREFVEKDRVCIADENMTVAR
jgi:hypothetical protein